MTFLVLPILLAMGGEGATPEAVLSFLVGVILLVGLATVGWRLMRYGEFRPRWSKAYLQISGIFGVLLILGAVLSASTVLTSLGFVFFALGAYGVLFGIIGYIYGGGPEDFPVS